MANINMNELTKEQIQKAMTCETAEELMELAKAGGIKLTKAEAEAYMAELEDFELDSETLSQVAGGNIYDGEKKKQGRGHNHCFVGDSEVAVPSGVKRIKDLEIGDKVITLDADGNEIVGTVTEVIPPKSEKIIEVTFSDGTIWHTTESQTLYFGHEKNCTVTEALGKTALKRGGAVVTVTDVKPLSILEPVYDVLIGEEEDEDVMFVEGIAAEGYFTKGERLQWLQAKTIA